MNTQDNVTETAVASNLERHITFYVLLILHIPSLCCSIFLLYHFKWKRLVSQIFGFLLIINSLIILSELPFTLLQLYTVHSFSVDLCSLWIIINYSLFVLSIYVTTWASFERYLFIFHEPFISRHRILLHYTPLVLFSTYTPTFYTGMVIFYPCQQAFTDYIYTCGGPCYLFNNVSFLLDWNINVNLIVIITCIINIVIILRNIIQRERMKKSIITAANRKQWHRTIKLSCQLFALSSLCGIGWIPYGIVSTIQILYNTPTITYIFSRFIIYLPYAQTLFLPYTCILFMPDMKQKITTIWKESICFKIIYHQNRVHVDFIEQNITLGRIKTHLNQRTL